MDRKLTESEVVEAVKISSTVSELEENLGEPNSNNVRKRVLVYEIEPENGEPRYMVVDYSIDGKLWKGVLNKEREKDDYVEPLYAPYYEPGYRP
jgi:hypothetical protein